MAVMSENHPLAAETELSLEQIANETLITLPPRCIPFQKGNQFQEYLTLHAQDHVHLVSDGEAESVLLAKCGYGIALLPGFFIEKELTASPLVLAKKEMACVPVAGTKNIGYGIYYRNKEKHIQTFVNSYKAACFSV